ncbi:MAG: hypothetical protein JNJ59_01040 [Deltaproteobacteria bacterium]|jgi:hypothetical protein|nr:hypothetical protein [Deltaproteobacteria bacterium]
MIASLVRQRLPQLTHLTQVRPGELRFLLDDALVLGWNTVARAREAALAPAHKELLRKNEGIRGIHRGKRCWILGNGPSLKDHDLLALRDEEVFVVNRFIHHPDADKIHPSFYVVIDPKFGAGHWGHDFVEEVEKRLPDVWVFTGYDGWKFLGEKQILQRHRRFVVHPNQLFHFGYPFEIDLTHGIPGSDNVTKTAVSIAVWMGFTEINLLGIDGNGLLLSENSHFYGHVPQPADQLELERSLASAAMSMRSWRALPDWLAKRGVRLVSRNSKSVLTALPYEPFSVPGL